MVIWRFGSILQTGVAKGKRLMQKGSFQELSKRNIALLLCILLILGAINLGTAWTLDSEVSDKIDREMQMEKEDPAGISEEHPSKNNESLTEQSDITENEHVHRFTARETVEPTCTEKGYTLYVCECGEASYRGDETEPLGHIADEKTVNTEATAESEGSITYICLTCGEEITEAIQRLEPAEVEEDSTEINNDNYSYAEEMKEIPKRPISDPWADLEYKEFWDELFNDIALSGDWSADLLTIAETQLGYAESVRNFEATLNEDGNDFNIKGWTRYGAWYGVPYGDWCAMFISFCLHYAGISQEDFPYESGTIPWVQKLKKMELYRNAEDCVPKPGDVIFFDWEADDLADHVGIVCNLDEDNRKIQTIEGNHGDTVQKFEYDMNDRRIMGYGVLPTNQNRCGSRQALENNGGFVPRTAFEMSADKKGSRNAEEPLLYMDENGVQQQQEEYEAFAGILESGKWYAVRDSFEVEQLSIRSGNVNLVLCDDTLLTVRGGIKVAEGASLTIWGQRNYSGQLFASGDRSSEESPVPSQTFGSPGIGGFPDGAGGCGRITINGGHITAVGGAYASGIGASEAGGSGSITINGGVDGSRTYVTAAGGAILGHTEQANPYAGVGIGGDRGNGTIAINGGTVSATGGNASAGVGGSGINVVINGGIVNAFGGKNGAGIGGSSGGTNGTVTINGGYIQAVAINPTETGYRYRNSAAGIGSGCGCDQGGKITISGGTVFAKSYGMGAGIGGAEDGTGNGCAGGLIEINGADSKVIAMSIYGSGIGGGGADVSVMSGTSGNGGTVTINNGFVYALSSAAGAGIGGGNGGNGGTVSVNNGYVIACSGSDSLNNSSSDLIPYGWCSDKGEQIALYMDDSLSEFIAEEAADFLFSADYSGAGIGGGNNGSGGSISVNGGTVVAKGGSNYCSAVGSGNNGIDFGSLILYDYAQVVYGHMNTPGICEVDGIETYQSEGDMRVSTAHIYSYVRIERGEVTVQFNVGEHGIAPESQSVILGGNASEPQTPTADGWLFGGWYRDMDCTTDFDFDESLHESIIIYGKWVRAYDLIVRKNWPEGKSTPRSAAVSYINRYSGDKTVEGTLTISESENWSAILPVTTESVLTFEELPITGFENEGWVLRCGSMEIELNVTETGSAILNFQDQSEQVREALITGELELTVKNMRYYSVKKIWDCEPQSFTTTINGAQEQACFEWPTVIDRIDVVLQHRQSTSVDVWETIETITLTGSGQWTGQFSTPITDDDSNYRIRELLTSETRNEGHDGFVLEDGVNRRLLFDQRDPDGSGEVPQFVFRHIETMYGEECFQGTFKVSYSWDNEGNFIIENKKCVFFSVEKVWERGYSNSLKPESIFVVLQYESSGEEAAEKEWTTVETRELSAANSWRTVFEHVCGDSENLRDDYRIRELSGSGELIYDPNDEDVPDGWEYAAAFTVIDEENEARHLLYDVTYDSDDGGHMIIINSGRIYSVEKTWDLKGTEGPAAVYVSLEKLKSISETGEELWVKVSEEVLTQSNGWTVSFLPVWEDCKYRVRELDGPGGSVIHDKHDADGNGENPVVSFRDPISPIPNPGSSYEWEDSYNVVYQENEQNTVIVNRQVGILFVEINWMGDDEGRFIPDCIDVILQREETAEGSSEKVWNTVETLVLNGDNNWTACFQHVCDTEEEIGSYRIRELDQNGEIVDSPNGSVIFTVGDGIAEEIEYDVMYDANGYGKTTITNDGRLYSVEKSWDVDTEGLCRPERIQVALQSSREEYTSEEDTSWTTINTAELNEENGWNTHFVIHNETDTEDKLSYRIRELDEDGKTVDVNDNVVYAVSNGDGTSEVRYVVKYESENGGKKTRITNTAVRDVDVEIQWVLTEGTEKPGSVTVRVMDGDTEVNRRTITNSDDWKWSFTNLPRFRNGEEITYSILEDPIVGYRTKVEGFRIINTRILTWVNLGATKSLRGRSLENGEFSFQLRDTYGRLLQTKTNDADGHVSFDRIYFTPNDLRRDEDGNSVETLYVFTIREEASRNELTYDGHTETVTVSLKDEGDGILSAEVNKSAAQIVFSNELEKVHLTVDKIWEDENEHKEYIPDRVMVRLYANGTRVRSVYLTKTNSWHYDFGDYNKYDYSHQEIVYTLTEDTIHFWNHRTVLNDGHFSVTNRFAEETYTIIYKTNGGVWSNGGSEDRYDTQLITKSTIIRDAPTRTGYTFVEWKGSSYQPGDVYNEKDTEGYYVSDILVAQWTKSPITGDLSNITLWCCAALGSASALGLTIAAAAMKKRRKERPTD